jgi:threonylcarbamoyladenosine tRNA methylthiotransferase MtaB
MQSRYPDFTGKNMPSVYVKTLGCKVNTFDSHALANQFQSRGFELLAQAGQADVTVVNTCSVTANAAREARYLARRTRRDNPKTLIVFTGCYAQTDSARLVAMDEIDCVVPNEIKERLVTIVQGRLEAKALGTAGPLTPAQDKIPSDVKTVKDNRQNHFKTAVAFFDHAHSQAQTRAFLKIQDGCDSFCAYCLIPYARGASRSVAPELILDEVKRLAASGCREIVLTGIHIGDYGRDLQEYIQRGVTHPVVELLSLVFLHFPQLRVRISSLEPSEVTPALIELLAAHPDQVCDHFHLPMQSGNDRILKLMRRSYTSAEYAATVALIRRYFPEASIGADVIPGFPSESATEHEETADFIRSLELSYLHVFPYSKRPNTAAARMPGHLEAEVVKERAAALRALSKELSEAYARQFIGRTLAVVWEQDRDASGRRMGHARNYLTIVAPTTQDPASGSFSWTHIKGFVEQGKLLGVPTLLA